MNPLPPLPVQNQRSLCTLGSNKGRHPQALISELPLSATHSPHPQPEGTSGREPGALERGELGGQQSKMLQEPGAKKKGKGGALQGPQPRMTR